MPLRKPWFWSISPPAIDKRQTSLLGPLTGKKRSKETREKMKINSWCFQGRHSAARLPGSRVGSAGSALRSVARRWAARVRDLWRSLLKWRDKEKINWNHPGRPLLIHKLSLYHPLSLLKWFAVKDLSNGLFWNNWETLQEVSLVKVAVYEYWERWWCHLSW